jgi:hypothetical protein
LATKPAVSNPPVRIASASTGRFDGSALISSTTLRPDIIEIIDGSVQQAWE